MPFERLKLFLLFLTAAPGFLMAQATKGGEDTVGGAPPPAGAADDGWGWIWFWVVVIIIIVILAAIWSSGRKSGGTRGGRKTTSDTMTRINGS